MASDKRASSLFSEESPLSLLVHAANAQDHTPGGEKELDAAESLNESQRALSKVKSVAGEVDRQSLTEPEIQEAIQREALHRDALQRQAALLGLGGASALVSSQEQEYLQQLRLEALVQQRRQETLAQLALAQEAGMSQDLQTLLNAQQLRQAALMRQDLLLGAGAGGLPGAIDQLRSQSGLRGVSDESLLLHYLEENQRQQKLAALARTATGNPTFLGANGTDSKLTADLIGSTYAKSTREIETAKEPLVDGSKTTFLPCRARGMPMDHNVKTAYFVIPEDIKHGAELVCSYFACRNAGIKFRYCTYCQLPVAKRNFCKRHKHPGKIRDAEGSWEDELSEEVKEPIDRLGETVTSSGKIKSISVKPKISEKIDANILIEMLLKHGSKEIVVPADGKGESRPKSPLSRAQAEKLGATRLEEWEKLLCKRPRSTSGEAIVSWARKVLALSDLDCVGEEDGLDAYNASVKASSIDVKVKNDEMKTNVEQKGRKEEGKPLDQKKTMGPKTASKAEEEQKKSLESIVQEAKGKKGETEADEVKHNDMSEIQIDNDIASEDPKRLKGEKGDAILSEREDADEKKAEEDLVEGGRSDEDDASEDYERADVVEDDDSTSSEDSVDLRASKKAKTA